MRTLREGGHSENPEGGDSVPTVGRRFSEIPQGGDSVRTLREGTQWEPPGRGLSENPQGGTQ